MTMRFSIESTVCGGTGLARVAIVIGFRWFMSCESSRVFVSRRPSAIRRQNEGRCFGAPWFSRPRSPGSAIPRRSGGVGVSGVVLPAVATAASLATVCRPSLSRRLVTSGLLTPVFLSRTGSCVSGEGVPGKTNSVDLSEISAPRVPEYADSAISPPFEAVSSSYSDFAAVTASSSSRRTEMTRRGLRSR